MAEPVLAALPEPTPAPQPDLRLLPAPAAPAPTEPRLEIPGYDLGAALALERGLGISHVLAQVLVRRGWQEPAAAREFLAAEEQHPPAAFAGIERAVELVRRHITTGQRITVHGDYDVDGVCATAIMVASLRGLGAHVDWYLPSRIDDGYGLAADTVERLAARGTRLLITVDCGITAVEEVAAARAAGLDVVLTDHHQPRADGALPDCPIVHPVVCGYPFPDLCGTAVAHKLAEALGADVAHELELVALATVADLMPLRGENRRLVREGLAAMALTGRPGLRALMQVARVDPSALDAGALGFRLAPRINAAGRLRRADAGVELMLTDDPGRAREIAHELDELNAERRAVEQRIAWEAESRVSELGERAAYVVAGEGWHPGVIGIVASRLVERHHRPVIMIALAEGEGTGSGRSIPGFDLLAALDACADELGRYGGHRAAAGLALRAEQVDGFARHFEAHAASVLTPELLAPVERVDAVVSGSQLGLELAEELQRLEPTGIGNPGVRLLIPGGRLGDPRKMGQEGRHLRFVVSAGGVRTPAVAFGCDGRLPVDPELPADATFRLERNCWNGAVEPRLVLRRAWGCRPAPVSVLGEAVGFLDGVLAELERPLPGDCDAAEPGTQAPGGRTVLDRRGESPLAVLADARAAGGEVLAVCAEVSRRLAALQQRAGGFALASHHCLEADPSAAARFEHIVVLDPPGCVRHDSVSRAGSGFTHLAWGDPELRFAQQMHEFEYALRAPLVALFRALRSCGRAAGPALEALLRGGDGPERPPRLAARLIRVLTELELAVFDPGLPALALAASAPTALERSEAYRAYHRRYEDGRRFLSSVRASR